LVLEKYWQRASEAKNHNANIVVLDALSQDPNSYVRSLVAQNPNSNIEILSNLSKDKSEEVRIEVARNPICNSEILANLSSDESEEVRREVATNLNTKPEILEILSKDQTESASQYPWDLVRAAVAKNINSTSTALETLSKDSNSYVRSVVGLNPNTSQETLSVLSRDEKEEVRNNVAGNPNTDPRVLLKLSRDSAKSGVATNPQSSLEILDLLSNDDDPYVRRNVASNPHSSPEILEYLSRDDDVEVRCEVARNRNVNSQILERLSRDGDDTVRRYIAEDDGANPDSLMILTQDSDYFIRFVLAQNPQANLEILDVLSRDDNAQVRSRVAEHRLVSPEILERLSRDQSPSVRSAVARSLNTPQETLRKLALDKSAEQGYRKVKSFVASNPNADSQILDVLSRDDDAEVRCQVARNPLASLQILELLSRDEDADVRLEVARNSHASLDILELLSKEITEIGEELESENVQELFRKANLFKDKGKHQFGADILFELASDGDLRSTVELANVFIDQEDFGVVEELLDDYPDQEDSTILYLRAKLSERTGSYDFDAYLRAAHAGDSSAALALVEHFASSDIYLAKRWLARAKEIGHPKIEYFHDMLTILPREKKFLINIGTEEVRVFDAKGIELVSTFEDLHEAVLYCLSKEGGFDVLHVDESGDALYSYFGSHMKVINTDELIIAGDSEYWFGRLEDMQDAIEEVEGTFGNWDLVIYDSIPYSSEKDSQSPVEWFPIEDEDEEEVEDEDEDEDEEDDNEQGFGVATVVSIKNLTLKNRFTEKDLSSTDSLWEKVHQDDQESWKETYAAGNPDTSLKSLRSLLKSDDDLVRYLALLNPNFPIRESANYCRDNFELHCKKRYDFLSNLNEDELSKIFDLDLWDLDEDEVDGAKALLSWIQGEYVEETSFDFSDEVHEVIFDAGLVFLRGNSELKKILEDLLPNTWAFFLNLNEKNLISPFLFWTLEVNKTLNNDKVSFEFDTRVLALEDAIHDPYGTNFLQYPSEFKPLSDLSSNMIINIEGGSIAVTNQVSAQSDEDLDISSVGYEAGSGYGDGYYPTIPFFDSLGNLQAITTFFNHMGEESENLEQLLLGTPWDNASIFGNRIPIKLGYLKSSGSLFFGDSGSIANGPRKSDTILEFQDLPEEEYLVIKYVDTCFNSGPFNNQMTMAVSVLRDRAKRNYEILFEIFPELTNRQDDF